MLAVHPSSMLSCFHPAIHSLLTITQALFSPVRMLRNKEIKMIYTRTRSADTGTWTCFHSHYPVLRRQWHPTPVLFPGKSHGRRSLVGCSPWGRWESDMTGRLLSLFSSCIGEGNGNPLQCSCLENPRDRGAWWAAVYGVAQCRTWLSSSSSILYWHSHAFLPQMSSTQDG